MLAKRGPTQPTAAAVVLAAAVTLMAPGRGRAAEYVVEPDDSLSRIARQQLGDAGRWREIAELNGIAPPYRIRVGQRLVLPSVESTAVSPSDPGAAPGAAGRPGPWTALGGAVALWVIGLLLAAWLLGAACLRAGCWFSLVETTFGRCCLLSFLLALTLGVGVGAMAGVGVHRVFSGGRVAVIAICVAAAAVLYLVGAVLITHRVLNCRWRSVLTVLVMAGFVADLVTMLVCLAAPLAVPGVAGAFGLIQLQDLLLPSAAAGS